MLLSGCVPLSLLRLPGVLLQAVVHFLDDLFCRGSHRAGHVALVHRPLPYLLPLLSWLLLHLPRMATVLHVATGSQQQSMRNNIAAARR